MKTKQLPKDFTFICDEHSREQLEKLGVDLCRWNCNDYNTIYSVKNNYLSAFEKDYPLINLADYLDQEQPEPKWQEKTRGGYGYHIYEEFDGNIFGRIKTNDEWIGVHWNSDGRYYKTVNDVWDLLPINHSSQP